MLISCEFGPGDTKHRSEGRAPFERTLPLPLVCGKFFILARIMALLTTSFLMVIAIAILIPQSQSTCSFTSKVAYCAHGLFTSDKDLNGRRVGIEYLRLDGNALNLTNNTFDGFKTLRRLYLNSSRLSNVPARAFHHLTFLQMLYLNFNNLLSVPEEVFHNLWNLQELYLWYAGLRYLPKQVFRDLRRLRNLDLSLNDLSDLPEDVFQNLRLLQQLSLGHNRLKNLPKHVFRNLKSLRVILIQGNRLSDLPGDVFQNLRQLRQLSLQYNRLKYLPKYVFRNLRSLTNLYIKGNRLEHLPKDVFRDLISLRLLDLSNNQPLQGLADNIFGYLKNLQKLYMDGIQFTSLPEEIFQGPINLIHLSLNYAVRVDVDCEGLCSLNTRPSSNLCFGKSILDYCSLPYCFPSNYSNHSALEATGSGVGRKYNNVTQYRVSWSCPAGEYATNRFTYCSQTNSTLTGAIDCKALNCGHDVPAISNGYITSDDHGLQVTCNTGYEVIGPAKVVCQGTSHRSPPGRCYDQDECNDETHLCKGNEQCSNAVASYTCHCSRGWTGDAGSCSDIDECISQHKCNLTTTTCKNTNGSYTCQCREGHIQVFPLACSDHDECGTGDDKCHVRSTCINTLGSYMCQCKEGWTGDGRHCSAETGQHNIIGIASAAACGALLLVIVVVMIISRQNWQLSMLRMGYFNVASPRSAAPARETPL